MIKSITITNFQSHVKTELTFAKGVNVIVGSSDSGKTAIIRALRWTIFNKPSGDTICSSWGGQTSVSVDTDEGMVEKRKGKDNGYILTPQGGQSTTFKAIGTGVPDEIASLFNINEINLQYQLDSPFLLSNSPGEVAQHFNRVARLDKIDQATSEINSALRAYEQDIRFLEANLNKQEEQLRTFDYLDKMEVEVEVLEELDKQVNTLWRNRSKLNNLIIDYRITEQTIAKHAPLLALEKDVLRIDKLRKSVRTAEDDLERLVGLCSNVRNIKSKLERVQRVVIFEQQVSSLITLTDKRDELSIKLGDITDDIKEIRNLNIRIASNERTNVTMQTQFDKAMGNVCILCGNPIKHKHEK